MHRPYPHSLSRPLALIIAVTATVTVTGSAAAQSADLTPLRRALFTPGQPSAVEPDPVARLSVALVEAHDPLPHAGSDREPGQRRAAQLRPNQLPILELPALARSPATSPPAECATPMSLMLHSSFGAERMAALAEEISRRGLKTVTYREVLQSYQAGGCPPSNALIVSIDDLGSSWLRPDFVSMIQAFTDRGLAVVVGVVVHGPQDPHVWEYLRQLEANGSEVASHTLDHHNLPELDRAELEHQIGGSRRIICEHLGRCPTTLILPYGNLDRHGRVLETAAGYAFVVGIPGGRSFGGESPFYLGRISPDIEDQGRTLHLLEASFGG